MKIFFLVQNDPSWQSIYPPRLPTINIQPSLPSLLPRVHQLSIFHLLIPVHILYRLKTRDLEGQSPKNVSLLLNISLLRVVYRSQEWSNEYVE